VTSSLTSGRGSITYVSEEVAIRGNTAFDRGTFSFTVVKDDGSKTAPTGKYLWLYERTAADEWKMSRVVVSLDDPPEDADS
jgi:ketosteroid isomerase-like protein